MAIPTTYTAAVLLCVLTMILWGSWANMLKLGGKWRFELFCYDFAIGALLCAMIASFTVGTYGSEITFLDNLTIVRKTQILFGFAGGAVFTIANMLLLAAISVAGLSVAFPIGIGLGLVIGVVWNYAIKPQGNPLYLFSGAAVVMTAIVVTALAHRIATPKVKRPTKVSSAPLPPPAPSALKGILLSVFAGILMGSFYPLVELGKEGDIEMGPYPIGFVFACAIFGMTFLFNLYFLNLPVQGKPLSILDYFSGTTKQHLLGWGGGAMWYGGTISNFVAASAPAEANVGPAVSFALGQGAALVSTLWGLLVWKEFAKAPGKAKKLIWLAVLLFVGGLALISIAPLFKK
ncbi:MAG: hypothetical protein FJW20_18585 [Acidimicrobiia bacterium]|nr:hypothetical protein [Acidimicrobiia bacterium]